MQAWFLWFFGEGSPLTSLQMSCRAVVCFFLVLALIRLSGRRSFGQHTAFDACVTVLLGAILSRAVVGASAFIATTCACLVVVLLHRLTAMLAARFALVDRLVNGVPRTLVREGRTDRRQMHKALVSEADLVQALREKVNTEQLEGIDKVTLERNGSISVLHERR